MAVPQGSQGDMVVEVSGRAAEKEARGHICCGHCTLDYKL